MTIPDFRAPHAPVRSRWREQDLLMRGPLTDRKIESYQKLGYYSTEYRQARRDRMLAKRAKQLAREGNFSKGEDGRLIYSPR